MQIIWVTTEAWPYAKTGGLADVSYALPKALAERGHQISVILPYYPQLMGDLCSKTKERYRMLGVPLGWNNEWAGIREDRINENLSFFFIEFNRYFDRPTPYDWDGIAFSDNSERFIFFSRAAMQAILALKMSPDIIHTNDWQTALCNIYLNSHLYSGLDNFKQCRSILTIHNLGYQGVFHKSNLYWTGLGWDYFNYTCLEYFDRINLLKGGIMTADMVNTVSPTYAAEILTPEFGCILEGPLQYIRSQGKLKGILNGIDLLEWNPETDPLIPDNYRSEKLVGKKHCKKALQDKFSLPTRAKTPLFGIVSRLAGQKGIDVLLDAIWDMLMNDDVQFIFLGYGESWLHNRLDRLAASFPDKLGVFIGHNNRLAHLIEAGSDMFVMPSRYEPCGLNQMYSMHYGTVPVVRAVGGLADTVVNYNPDNLENATGFMFKDLHPLALRNTLRWATSVYTKKSRDFKKLIQNGMKKDFSWEKTAILYEKLYTETRN